MSEYIGKLYDTPTGIGVRVETEEQKRQVINTFIRSALMGYEKAGDPKTLEYDLYINSELTDYRTGELECSYQLGPLAFIHIRTPLPVSRWNLDKAVVQ